VNPSDQILVTATVDDMAIDDDFVYFLSTADGTVSRVSKAGGNPMPLATGQAQPKRLAVDGQYVYFTNLLGAVMRMSKTGGDAAPFAAGNKPWGIALSADTVYYANTGTNQILSAQKADGTPGTVVSLDATAQELVYDGTVIDFITGFRPGEIMFDQWHMAWVSPTEGVAHWIDGDNINGCSGCCGQPQTLAGDADNVYWPCSALDRGIYITNKATATRLQAAIFPIPIGNHENAHAVALEPDGLFVGTTARVYGRLSCSDEIIDRPLSFSALQVLTDSSSIFVRASNGGSFAIYKMPK
jgi:hypothetical protein